MTLRAQSLSRAAASSFVIGVCLVWGCAGAAPWLSQRWSREVQAGERVPQRLLRLLWADAPTRIAARQLLLEGLEAGEGEAEGMLIDSARARPLYAPTWLERARLALRRGDRERADAYATLSARLWPKRSRHLWRIAMLRIQMGDRDGAFRALRAHQRGRATGMDRVLWIAERLEPDPERLGAQLLPDPDWAPSEADAYLAQLLAVAAKQGRLSLVRAAWGALSETARAEPYTVRSDVDALLAAGLVEEASAVWRRYWKADAPESPITNPSFEQELALAGLGWRVHAAQGAGWARDRQVSFDGAYSLRIWFDGSEDLEYRHAFQRVPVRAGGTYRLTGRWRGADITTSSGPYLEVVSYDSEPPLVARAAARTGSWEWSPFEVEFRVPAKTRLVQIRVRRDRERGPTGEISGSLWLDDLALARVGNG